MTTVQIVCTQNPKVRSKYENCFYFLINFDLWQINSKRNITLSLLWYILRVVTCILFKSRLDSNYCDDILWWIDLHWYYDCINNRITFHIIYVITYIICILYYITYFEYYEKCSLFRTKLNKQEFAIRNWLIKDCSGFMKRYIVIET